jgi:hypothetical protein
MSGVAGGRDHSFCGNDRVADIRVSGYGDWFEGTSMIPTLVNLRVPV